MADRKQEINFDELITYVGSIPNEAAELSKYIICELVVSEYENENSENKED